MSTTEITHINDEETEENIETEPNFSEPMSTIDMTHFNDETMGSRIEREPNSTGFDGERNETMRRMAISLCSDEQFNSHNEIPIGNTTWPNKMTLAIQGRLEYSQIASMRVIQTTQTKQYNKTLKINPNTEMQQDIEGKGTTHLDIKLDYDKSHDVTFSSHTHNDEETQNNEIHQIRSHWHDNTQNQCMFDLDQVAHILPSSSALSQQE